MRFRSASTAALKAALTLCGIVGVLHATAVPAAAQGKKTKIIIHPLLIQAPLFGASVDLPSLPSLPPGTGGGDETGAASGSTDVSLNTIYMAGAEVQAERWFGEVNFTLAAVSAERNAPRIAIDSDAKLFNARGGVRLYKGLAATVGVRYVGVELAATVTLPVVNKTIQGTAKPTLWDPMIGADWRGELGDRWTIDASFEGGGFGVGTDVNLVGEVTADWRVAGPFQIRFGYKSIYYKMTVADVSIGAFKRTLVSSQSLHGPVLGFGFVF